MYFLRAKHLAFPWDFLRLLSCSVPFYSLLCCAELAGFVAVVVAAVTAGCWERRMLLTYTKNKANILNVLLFILLDLNLNSANEEDMKGIFKIFHQYLCCVLLFLRGKDISR